MKNLMDLKFDEVSESDDNLSGVSVNGSKFHFKTVEEIRQDWFSFFDGKRGHRVDGVPNDFDEYLNQVLSAQEQYKMKHGAV